MTNEDPSEKGLQKFAEKQAIQVWKNAPEEERGFVRNPKATRGFKSMVSIPILRGGNTTGVFNVVTDQESAFDPADINYLTSLGSIIQLAFGMALEEMRAEKAAAQARKVSRVLEARTLAPLPGSGVSPPTAPQGDIDSSDAADRREASDE